MNARTRKAMLRPVPCPSCQREMPAGRLAPAMLATTLGICGQCRHDQCTAAHVPAPMYETDAWSRGIRL